ncbi:LysR substrate binding domain protein [compost metagenome]
MPVLAEFSAAHPGVRLEVTSGLSGELLRLYQGSDFDLLLVKRMGDPGDCLASWPEPIGWADSATRPAFGREPLPLVVFPAGGLYRNEMLHGLDVQDRRWRIAYSSASLASVCAAVAAGLGVSLLPLRVLGPEHRLLGEAEGLPEIQGLRLALYGRAGLGKAGDELVGRLEVLCGSDTYPL